MKYIVQLTTDIFGNYFVTDINEADQVGDCSLRDALKEEINNMGLDEYLDFSKGIELEPNSKYKCKLYFIEEFDFYDNLLQCVPTITEVELMKEEGNCI